MPAYPRICKLMLDALADARMVTRRFFARSEQAVVKILLFTLLN
jgi:hypothetical protein